MIIVQQKSLLAAGWNFIKILEGKKTTKNELSTDSRFS